MTSFEKHLAWHVREDYRQSERAVVISAGSILGSLYAPEGWSLVGSLLGGFLANSLFILYSPPARVFEALTDDQTAEEIEEEIIENQTTT